MGVGWDCLIKMRMTKFVLHEGETIRDGFGVLDIKVIVHYSEEMVEMVEALRKKDDESMKMVELGEEKMEIVSDEFYVYRDL